MIATALVLVPMLFAATAFIPALARRSREIAIAAGLTLAAGALVSPVIPVRPGVRLSWATTLGLTYAVDLDALSVMFVALTGLAFALAAASSDRVGRARAYYALLCVALGTLTGATVARDLGLFFVFWEATFACIAVLIAEWGGERRGDAALRVVLTALVGSALYLIVIASLGVLRGTLDVDVLRARPLPASGQLVPAVLLSAAFLVTLPVLPFHSWLIRSLVAAPRAVAILLVTVVPNVALYALVRFCLGLFPQGIASAAPALVSLAAVGTVYGAVLASRQDDVRRLLAFAALASIDFAALGIFAGTDLGVRGGILAAFSRSFVLLALIVLAGHVVRRTGSTSLTRIGGIGASTPVLTAFETVTVLAALGIPGSSGFAADVLVLAGAVERFPAATAVASLVLVISAIGGARLLRRAFHGPALARATDISWHERVVVVPLLLLILAIGIAPRVITDRIPSDAVPALEAPR